MLFAFFARESKRRDATAKRSRDDASADRIDSANENLRATTASTRLTRFTAIDRAPTSAEIAAIVDHVDDLSDNSRVRFATNVAGRHAVASASRHTSDI